MVMKTASGYGECQQLNFRQATSQTLLKVTIFCVHIFLQSLLLPSIALPTTLCWHSSIHVSKTKIPFVKA